MVEFVLINVFCFSAPFIHRIKVIIHFQIKEQLLNKIPFATLDCHNICQKFKNLYFLTCLNNHKISSSGEHQATKAVDGERQKVWSRILPHQDWTHIIITCKVSHQQHFVLHSQMMMIPAQEPWQNLL